MSKQLKHESEIWEEMRGNFFKNLHIKLNGKAVLFVGDYYMVLEATLNGVRIANYDADQNGNRLTPITNKTNEK